MIKYDFYRSWYSLSNGVSSVFLPRDFKFNFQGQMFKILISRKTVRAGAKCLVCLLCKLIIANECHYCECCSQWPWPKFSRSNFSNGYFDKYRLEEMQTLLLPSGRKSDICRTVAQLQMLSIITLIYIFKVSKFEMWFSWKRWELAKSAQVWLSYIEHRYDSHI